MSETLISPGVFLRENDLSQIQEGPITVGAALLGPTVLGPVNVPTVVRSYSDYKSKFGSLFVSGGANYEYLTSIAALNYFEQGGETLLVTRVVSGTFTAATASIPAYETLISGVAATGSLNLTSAATVPYSASINGTSFLLSGSSAQDVFNRVSASINSNTVINVTASYSAPNLILTSKTKGTIGNAYYITSGSTTTYFSGGTDVTSFVLETLSEGEIMNNDVNAQLGGSALQSGSLNNIRWEVTFSDTSSGLFSVIIRRGDDFQNQKTILETWNNLSLDPNSNNYIAYVIGDQKITATGVDESGTSYLEYQGSYPNQSRYIRVKSVDRPTPGYLNNLGQANPQYTSSLPLAGSGSYNGSYGGATGTTITAGPINLFENIPATAATYINNIQGVVGNDYNIAISILKNKDQYDYKTIYAPGLNAQNASSQIASLTALAQERGTCISVVDMTGYNQTITAVTQQAAAIDSSYAATYWPWVQLRSRETGKLFFCPASTIVPAAYEYNDRVAAEWFAPAGLTRGGLTTVIQPERRLTAAQRDTLYANKVNPIGIFPGQGTVIYGQKTLQSKATALDRVNVRRLIIALKSYIGQVAEGLLFEQNTQTTRNNFLNQVNPYLQYVQQRQGLFAFRVVMDDTNNTPDVIDRNQLVGAIYLQPTRTAEYILLDFNILPTGATFGS